MSSRVPLPRCSVAILLLLMLVACGCASGPKPWVENGVKRGTINVSDEKGGKRWAYRDHSGHTRRVEHRTSGGALKPEIPIQHYDYDARGRVVQLSLKNSRGEPVLGARGFAAVKVRFESSERGEQLTHHEHYDTQAAALTIPAGYFRETFTVSAKGQLVRRQYFGLDGQRVTVRRNRHDNVHEITYAYLKGVTPVIMEVLVDVNGEPIQKRQVSGHTSLRIEDRIDDDGYDYYYE